jgi:hypothetical protein
VTTTREPARAQQECACGHLRASHRAGGCVALVDTENLARPCGELCGCREYEERA